MFLVQDTNIKIVLFTISITVSPFRLETNQNLIGSLSSVLKIKYDNECCQWILQEQYFPSNVCLKLGHIKKNTHNQPKEAVKGEEKCILCLSIHVLEIPGDREEQIRPVKILKLNEKVQKQAQTASHYRLKNQDSRRFCLASGTGRKHKQINSFLHTEPRKKHIPGEKKTTKSK